MLDLDDPRWAKLGTVYGDGRLTADRIKEWMSGNVPFSEISWPLYEELVHQGDCTTASYAALPHIVNGAITRGLADSQGSHDFNGFFQLVSGIETTRCCQSGASGISGA